MPKTCLFCKNRTDITYAASKNIYMFFCNKKCNTQLGINGICKEFIEDKEYTRNAKKNTGYYVITFDDVLDDKLILLEHVTEDETKLFFNKISNMGYSDDIYDLGMIKVTKEAYHIIVQIKELEEARTSLFSAIDNGFNGALNDILDQIANELNKLKEQVHVFGFSHDYNIMYPKEFLAWQLVDRIDIYA